MRAFTLAEAFGWFGYSILEEMDMEEAIEKLEERVKKLERRTADLERRLDVVINAIREVWEAQLKECKEVRR